MSDRLGVVVIGRNEGERLRRCLESVQGRARTLVYVDSGSTDGSPEAAAALGAIVCRLDMTVPFTAARARNVGWRRLASEAPDIDVVQFVDGDCEVAPGWPAAALSFLVDRTDVAAVCGRRRERFPGASVYNRLCDLEWDTPVGEAKACGGDAAIRLDALRAAGGYLDDLIAGEEPELCVRLRAAGWKVWRLDAEMTRHDAAMTRFAQWWKRSQRAGYAYAAGAHLHGGAPERHWVRESRSAWVWGAWLPLGIAGATISVGPIALAAIAVYPLQAARLFFRGRGPWRDRSASAVFTTLAKFAEASGQLRFTFDRLGGRKAQLIEYK